MFKNRMMKKNQKKIPAKIELNMSKFPDSRTQNIDQVNLLVEFIRNTDFKKMTIVAITVKTSLISRFLKE